METASHKSLKTLAALWAREQGFSCWGAEIGIPNTSFRADVAAYRPASEIRCVPNEQGGRRRLRDAAVGVTALFECKQTRSDLLRDSALAELASRKLRELQARRETLERLLRVHYPSALASEMLFAEYDIIPPGAIAHSGYQRVLREMATLQRTLIRRTKFERMIRYRCGNLHYLVAPEGLLEEAEVPLQWGLLVPRGDRLEVGRRPIWIECPIGTRIGLLHRIAQAACRRASEAGLGEQGGCATHSGLNAF